MNMKKKDLKYLRLEIPEPRYPKINFVNSSKTVSVIIALFLY